MTKDKHTELPWSVKHSTNGHVYVEGICRVLARGGNGVEQNANAAFIVQAVNAHDELVKALKAIRELQFSDGDEPLDDAISIADKALAKAGVK